MTTKEQLETLRDAAQYLIDGADVEMRTHPVEDWEKLTDKNLYLLIDCAHAEIRVKPKPRIIWVNENSEGDILAVNYKPINPKYHPYRELTPEEREELKI
jgi:hypothetical protein